MNKSLNKHNINILTGLFSATLIFCSSAFSWGGHDGPGRGHGGDGPNRWGPRYDYHDGRFFRHGWFNFGASLLLPPVGAIITGLPDGYVSVMIGGIPYYYYGGVYYRPCSDGFVVVEQPVAVTTTVTKYKTDTVVVQSEPTATAAPTAINVSATKTADLSYSGTEEETVSGSTTGNISQVSASKSVSGLSNSSGSSVKNGKYSEDTVTINVPSNSGYVPVKLIKKSRGYVGPQGEFYPDHPTIAQLKALYGGN
jgi:hypothetical protein